MSKLYPVNPSFAAASRLRRDDYTRLYAESVSDPEGFWGRIGQRLDWIKPPTKIKDVSFDPKDLHIRWYEDGELNVSANCLDRQLEKRGDKVAIIFEGDDPKDSRKITYRELHAEVCKFANTLKHLGVVKGDRVAIYLPMIPEAAVAMLACARLGAIHSVVFGGFSPDSLAGRIVDSQAKVVITADEGRRAGKHIPLKVNVDAALERPGTNSVETVIVVRHTGGAVHMQSPRDRYWHTLMEGQSADCAPTPVEAEHPLFVLYTSGSTGKPKGVQHSTGGYLVFISYTHEQVFDLREDDIYWCTADVGWVTGHSYVVYGPLCNGATTVMFEGVPNYPDHSRFWQVIDKHQVSIFYTAPTAIRALMREGEAPVKKCSRASLRLLGSVGEPINPEAWEWYYRVVGEERCPIVDTWWQTETGGIMISPLPGAIATKPGSATLPFFGVKPAIIDAEGTVQEGVAEGNLLITDSWPGQVRTIYGDHQRFIETYFSAYPGNYFSGDGARRDEDGYYWITGRVDDVINVSGHRLGTAEVESALVAHPKVAEAAVVGCPHEIKGQGIYAYVTLVAGETGSDELRKELIAWVRKEIGPIATPDYLQWAPGLPKTRSGKIMRRILRKIGENLPDQLGDITTLADPSVVKNLVDERLIK
ncbi:MULTISPECIES: acetate--CoA ligase [Rhodanobacter]|uniref:acetate--CoA ligase n=1 Tax=Rhodanobacter TaxID=75309 RepID=UPI000260E600|nr:MULTISPECIES: acetate--CoA ligase [Rhodanobacter]EIM03140.1 acetyl-CoA synthetase [Rhodanobacter denitrificans]UJJ51127.1 acetate--CoA ligase [Rhodanobacter denitrificans]UJJ60092.1 acetate--CoA ligase [Rhodanobacter denitrificans]UJM90340.1 acetate--CoA ligase [Rhodanobacter denitrificans]UJM93874.1 acetate--CoA ligase [Rhodanobacter denitrificans]